MYYENIVFIHGIPLSYEGWNVGTYHLHAHRDVIEILLVIKGKATVTVSCETFEMDEGDYAVIREQDAHMFTAADSGCELVSLYFNMEEYVEKIPYLYYVIFGCESFDLAKYRNETIKIRRLIVSIIMNLIRNDEGGSVEAMKVAENLLWLLVNDYDMVKYYNRKWDVPFVKVEKYYKIMGYAFEYYYMKNIQEYISSKEFYSKSYITHLFKEVGATSFKDMLDYVRIFKSEELLVNANLSINDISDQCGFSDVKYYNANFKKWFQCTPSEYRKRAIHEISKKSICTKLDASLIGKRIRGIILDDRDDSQYRAAVTPLSLKVFRNEDQSFRGADEKMTPNILGLQSYSLTFGGQKHFLPLRLNLEMLQWEDEKLRRYILSYENCYYLPVFIVQWGDLPEMKMKALLQKIFTVFMPCQGMHRIVYIMYYDLGDYNDICPMVSELCNGYEKIDINPVILAR